MSNFNSLPISEIIKKGKELEQATSDEPQPKRSRSEAYKKAKELEEARKAGDAPALVDEEGRDINPHIPQYISSVPFFYNTNHPTLKHQRSYKADEKQAPPVSSSSTFQRGVKIQTATKWRPGACENCGAMDHKRKDCLERPRKVGARFTNKNIAPDALIPPEERHSYESKRDRWSGYHPEVHNQIIEEYKRVEEAQRRLKESSLRREAEAAASKSAANDSNDDDQTSRTKDAGDCDTTNKPQTSTRETGDVDLDDSLSDDSDDDEDDEKYADKADMPGTKVDSKQRITVRNLRIREDTAKYLINLDPNSAYYDPKTRSMRENPLPAGAAASSSSSSAKAIAVDDNFVRYSGDVTNYNKARRFAWEASEKGVDVHLEALPTKTAMIQKEFEAKRQEYDERVSKFIEETYGPNLAQPASELQVSQSERYVEFSRTGRVLCGPAKPPLPTPPPPPPGETSSNKEPPSPSSP